MPIIKIKKTHHYTYAIWEITENVSELFKKLNPNKTELTHLQKINHLMRKKQSISSRLILNKLAKQKITILYKECIPYCDFSKNISISHSGKYSIVLISNQSIGLDIQKEKEQIEPIKHKFVSDLEEKKINLDTMYNDLHFIWTSKEAIYKTLGGLSCSFKKNIFIEKFNTGDALGYFRLNNTEIKYDLENLKFHNLFLSIAKRKN